MKEFYQKYSLYINLGIGALILAALIFVGYKVYNFFKEPDRSQDLLDSEINTQHLTYSVPEYTILADGLEEAMNTTGTDEAAIFDIFNQLQTKDDLLQLIVSFGARDNHIFMIPISGANLIQWLYSELSGSDLQQIRDKFNQFGVPF